VAIFLPGIKLYPHLSGVGIGIVEQCTLSNTTYATLYCARILASREKAERSIVSSRASKPRYG
jgi:hypothetical protein